MQTFFPSELVATQAGAEANEILRTCVHCGLCTATCPTYQVLGNELDSPRGRIYLIKSMLEEEPVSEITRTHLDRCLTCRACETTCPSGVNYHRLLDIGRAEIERRVPRPLKERWLRSLLLKVLPYRRRFTPLLRVGQWLRPLLPAVLAQHVPARRSAVKSSGQSHARRVVLVQGCVQPGLSPATNQATVRVLAALGIEAVTVAAESCCGAMSFHMSDRAQALQFARRNIDAWWPLLESGAEAIVMNASGCSNFVQDYAVLLEDDPNYAARAVRVVESLRDISQVLLDEELESLAVDTSTKISWHCPCTAQHGQDLDGPTREVLQRLGFVLPKIADAHLCCGSAGTYSLAQPEIAAELRRRKLAALEATQPAQIVTANIGCQVHLGAGTQTPVVHWIELVARALESTIEQ
jgi:glycolate oxidase iron-sulfur subunit